MSTDKAKGKKSNNYIECWDNPFVSYFIYCNYFSFSINKHERENISSAEKHLRLVYKEKKTHSATVSMPGIS